jgi:hypothetical protein
MMFAEHFAAALTACEEQLKEAVGVIESVEWVLVSRNDRGPIRRCPHCWGYEKDGHRDDCKLAAVLKKARGE